MGKRPKNMARKRQHEQRTDWVPILAFIAIVLALAALVGVFAWRPSGSSYGMMGRGMMRGSPAGSPSAAAAATIPGVQEVSMRVNGLDYEPNTLTVRAGQKVRWTIDATNAAGCAHSLISPAIGVNTVLKSGENVIEFVPQQPGEIRFTCSMGMTDGRFLVV